MHPADWLFCPARHERSQSDRRAARGAWRPFPSHRTSISRPSPRSTRRTPNPFQQTGPSISPPTTHALCPALADSRRRVHRAWAGGAPCLRHTMPPSASRRPPPTNYGFRGRVWGGASPRAMHPARRSSKSRPKRLVPKCLSEVDGPRVASRALKVIDARPASGAYLIRDIDPPWRPTIDATAPNPFQQTGRHVSTPTRSPRLADSRQGHRRAGGPEMRPTWSLRRARQR